MEHAPTCLQQGLHPLVGPRCSCLPIRAKVGACPTTTTTPRRSPDRHFLLTPCTCTPCAMQGGDKCSEDPSKNEYAGYTGAFQCMADAAVGVAYVKESTFAAWKAERGSSADEVRVGPGHGVPCDEGRGVQQQRGTLRVHICGVEGRAWHQCGRSARGAGPWAALAASPPY